MYFILGLFPLRRNLSSVPGVYRSIKWVLDHKRYRLWIIRLCLPTRCDYRNLGTVPYNDTCFENKIVFSSFMFVYALELSSASGCDPGRLTLPVLIIIDFPLTIILFVSKHCAISLRSKLYKMDTILRLQSIVFLLKRSEVEHPWSTRFKNYK